jgi:hypothetical protein
MRFKPWKCPECGQPAAGALETVPGLALLVFDDGGQAQYEGETKIDWNGQATCRDESGKAALECPAGHRWPAELVGEPAEADASEAVSEEKQCAESPTGRHVPDPKSIRPADGTGRNRGTDWLIDVNCLHCGGSGSTWVDPNDLQW